MNTFLIINFFIVVILLFLVVSLLIRVKRLEAKSIDVTPKDVATFVDQMREMVIESERAAEQLDASIRERETVLEDLSALVESRLTRLGQLDEYENNPTLENIPIGDNPLQAKVYRLLMQGSDVPAIAKNLNISVTEVEMIIRLLHG